MHFFAHLHHNLLNIHQRWKHFVGGNILYNFDVQGLLVNDKNMKTMCSRSAVQIFLATTMTFTKDMAMSKHGRATVQFV